MRKIILVTLMALSAALTAVAVDPSGTLPVMYITTENGAAVTSKEVEVNATCYIDPKGQTVSGTTGSADAPLTMTIAGRGNYSWSGFEKKPYKIKFPSKPDLMGLPKHKNFALMAAADDNLGYLRNVTGFYLSRLLGLEWTPNDIPIEVVLNGDYIGVYFLTETVKVDANRVNVTKQADQATTDVDGGWLVEIDNYDTDPHVTVAEGLNGSYRDGSGNPYNIWFTYKAPELLSSEQDSYLSSQMSTINNLIYATDKSTCGWADYIDLDQAARYFLVQELMDDYESYHGSCYLHRERGESEKWKFGPVWDFGSALMNDSKPSTIAADRTWHQVWIAEMMKFPAFKAAVKAVWAEFAAAHSIDEIKTYINAQANKIASAMPRDHQRWPNYGTDNEASCANTLINRLTSAYNWCASTYSSSASGYTYSVLGDFSGSWEGGETAMTLGADGLWRCTITPAKASGEFGVRQLEGSNQKAWLANGSLTFSNGTSGSIASVSGTNCKFSLTAGTAYTFTFNEDSYQLTVAEVATDPDPDPELSFEVIGSFTGDSWVGNTMTKGSDGKWTVVITPSRSSGQFLVHETVSNTWYKASSATLSESNTSLSLPDSNGGDINFNLTAGTAYTFTWDYQAKTLSISWAGSTPTTVTYALYGNFSGSWGEYSMTDDGSGVWKGSVTPSNASGAFGIRLYEDGQYNNRWLNVASATTLSEENVTATLQEKSSASAGQDINYTLTADKAYTFTFKPTDMSLTLSWSGSDPDPDPQPTGKAPESLYIFGNINSTGWNPNNANALTLSDDGNSYSIVQEIVSSGYFSFAVVKGSSWNDVNAKPRYGATSKDLSVEVGNTYDVKLFSSDTDPKAADCYSWKIATGTYLFTVDFSTDTPTLTIAPEPQPTITIYFKDDTASPWSSVNVYTWDKSNSNKE
ncbi:MAG: CotH kinase family protein, partial [Muribaculaceae bacterium]